MRLVLTRKHLQGGMDMWGVGCGCFVASVREQKKNPVNWHLQGVGDDVEVPGGWHGRWFGCLNVSWMWRTVQWVFVARVHESMKKPRKCQFTGPVVIPKSSCVCLGCFQPVCSPSKGARRGGASHHEIESKRQVPDPQECRQHVYLSPRSGFGCISSR